jgi:5-methylcytosine-specific restriction enzyme subunit McrC
VIEPPSAQDVTVVDVVEYGIIDVPVDLWVGDGHQAIFNSEIDGRDVLRPSFAKGRLRLQATSYVGVIPINDRLVVRVSPRVPLANLTRMVVETNHSVMPLTALREYTGRGSADKWAMDLYTSALLDYVDLLLSEGLLRTYVRREGEGHFPHGRIELSQTIQRFAARGIPNKAAYSWHERTIDNPPNRCVKAAMEVVYAFLNQMPAPVSRKDRQRLTRLAGQLQVFREVSDEPDLRFLNDPEVIGTTPLPDSRSYYRPVLDLAIAIVRQVGLSLDLGGDDMQMASLLIDTNKLFENFVRVSLAKHAVRNGWTVSVLDGNGEGKVDLYDVPDPLPSPLGEPMVALASVDPGKAQPDVVFQALDGTVPFIAEIKNTDKGKHASAPDRGEVEQAVTYALRYGLDFTVLIHPWMRGETGLVYVGRIRTIDVYDYRLDLSTDAMIDEALIDMAETFAQLARIAAV